MHCLVNILSYFNRLSSIIYTNINGSCIGSQVNKSINSEFSVLTALSNLGWDDGIVVTHITGCLGEDFPVS